MITAAKFRSLQQLFFTKVTSVLNPGVVTFKFISVSSGNDFEAFTGDGGRTISDTIEMKCFYSRNISDKQREKFGVSQEVTDIIYVSPLELQSKYGSMTFPEHIRKSYSQFEVSFLGNHYEIYNIEDLEPMQFGKEYICLAYQLNLINTRGTKGI